MSEYRYVTQNLLTGAVQGDALPLVVSSVSRVLSGVGDLTGYLPLQGDAPVDLARIAALTPRKTALFVLQDGYPIWGGIVWDTPHQSAASEQLPIHAQTIESLFQRRLLTGALGFTDVDVFDIMRALFQYGTDPRLGPNAGVAGLQYQYGQAGVTDTVTFGVSNTLTAGVDQFYGVFADHQDILSAAMTLGVADQVEFTFEPTAVASGGFGWLLRLGYPALGQYGAPVQSLLYPGNVLDYGRPTMGSNSANHVIGTSSGGGSGSTYTSAAPHGTNTAELAAGLPLLQTAVSWPGTGVTDQAQIDGYVDTLLGQYSAGTMLPSPVLGGDTQPLLRTLGLGDQLSFSASSSLDPPDPVSGAPGLQVTGRLAGWTLTPPAANQPEKVELTLGALVGFTSHGAV